MFFNFFDNKVKIEHQSFDSKNCRRYQLDRRVIHTNFLTRIFQPGVRSQHRRTRDQDNFVYLDRHEPHLLIIATIVIIFSIIDAFLTLKIISTGGVELNFFADKLIGLGLYGFIFSKYLITALGMVVLVLHKHYKMFFGLQVKYVIYGICFIYVSLIVYELLIIVLFAA